MSNCFCLDSIKNQKTSDFWDGIPAQETKLILEEISCGARVYPCGCFIEHEETEDSMLYLKHGQVTAFISLENGKNIPLRFIQAGEMFGLSYPSLLTGSLTFQVKEEASIYFLRKSLLLEKISQHPQLLSNYLSFVNQRTAFLLNKTILFSIQSNRQRIACFFLNEIRSQNTCSFQINLSKSCMLDCLGMSRSSFYRELNALQKTKAIELVDKNKYRCCPHQLEAIMQEEVN
ncbi:Crp/Fnr family transcriptional regulator [Tindallia californiensis]|uniref:cAMP-binding domain of CRP or a regulatory subunit of cAMP-dependent protein kinases n=1 Tax=Tindallia californiensis TaxID=159292 RepID=A0A1H3R6S5_9FIRM|nr:Crp/Fnr family transcriptional regulator [Tindallia californiensis]SDZ20971.1 cAMP-binding domain of CRP or a regulatory subunit of cAMP-dependent protein kinases [Tindallia californiensis]